MTTDFFYTNYKLKDMGVASKAFVMYEPIVPSSKNPERIKLLNFVVVSSAPDMLWTQEGDTVVDQQTVNCESKEFSMSNQCFKWHWGINGMNR